jgi:hypothetical protein
MGARHGDEMLGAFQTDRIMAPVDERFEVAPRPAAKVEYCKRRLALDVLQQRFNVLADVVIARAFPELFGTLIVMLQRTLGDGLPAAPITAFDLSSFVRFDGGFTSANINGTTLADTILPITNQFGDFSYARRTGDFLYSTARAVNRNKIYKVVSNSFATRHAASLNAYFGGADLVFEPVPGLMLKSTISAALAA